MDGCKDKIVCESWGPEGCLDAVQRVIVSELKLIIRAVSSNLSHVDGGSTWSPKGPFCDGSCGEERTQAKLPRGATVIPIILSSDKTKLSMFSEDKKAYRVYINIGDVPKTLRRKPSAQAHMILAYLPTQSIHEDNLAVP
ncbi:hypothetical protein BJV74DRAFT_900518 [Russula compacta]|nr:hypothetical protein BJV74DRAFT_900518 [Russula compacta]